MPDRWNWIDNLEVLHTEIVRLQGLILGNGKCGEPKGIRGSGLAHGMSGDIWSSRKARNRRLVLSHLCRYDCQGRDIRPL
jgi:hypothetical protein